jgi:hypothetical protein
MEELSSLRKEVRQIQSALLEARRQFFELTCRYGISEVCFIPNDENFKAFESYKSLVIAKLRALEELENEELKRETAEDMALKEISELEAIWNSDLTTISRDVGRFRERHAARSIGPKYTAEGKRILDVAWRQHAPDEGYCGFPHPVW